MSYAVTQLSQRLFQSLFKNYKTGSDTGSVTLTRDPKTRFQHCHALSR